MQPTPPHNNLWDALVTGGSVSSAAISNFASLSVKEQESTFKQLFHHAEMFVEHLIAEERTADRHTFRVVKDKLLRVLDALPVLTVTDTLREEAAQRLAEIDKRSQPLMNIDIAMKCDEIAKKLAPVSLSDLKGPTVIQCSSMADLKEKLKGTFPPSEIDQIIAEIEKSGGGILFGFEAINKKRPSKEN